VCQRSDHFPLDGDSVLVDFLVKCFAQSDGVCRDLMRGGALLPGSEPKLHPIEEMEARPVNEGIPVRLILGPEEDGGRKDALESLYKAAVVAAILGEAKEIEQLGSALEANLATLLLDGERGDPNGNETILTEREAVLGMPRDIEEELSVAAGVSELVFGRPS